jgi:hypothetical protein
VFMSDSFKHKTLGLQKIFSLLRKSRKKGGQNGLLPSRSLEKFERQCDCGSSAAHSLNATMQSFEKDENGKNEMRVSAGYPG